MIERRRLARYPLLATLETWFAGLGAKGPS